MTLVPHPVPCVYSHPELVAFHPRPFLERLAVHLIHIVQNLGHSDRKKGRNIMVWNLTLSESNSLHLKIGYPKRKLVFILPTIHFQVQTVSFRECIFEGRRLEYRKKDRMDSLPYNAEGWWERVKRFFSNVYSMRTLPLGGWKMEDILPFTTASGGSNPISKFSCKKHALWWNRSHQLRHSMSPIYIFKFRQILTNALPVRSIVRSLALAGNQ